MPIDGRGMNPPPVFILPGKKEEKMLTADQVGVEKLEELVIPQLRRAYSDYGFESLYLILDALHDWVSAGRLADVTNLAPEQVKSWLEELAFTARETIREIEARENRARIDR